MNIIKRRIYAFAIDLYAILFISHGLIIVYSQFMQKMMPALQPSIQHTIRQHHNIYLSFTLNIVFFSYFFLCYLLSNGSSLGKMAMQLRVYSQSCPTLQWQQALKRAIGQYLYFWMMFLPFLLTMVRPQSATWSDAWAHTWVADEGWKPSWQFSPSQQLALPLLNAYEQPILLPAGPITRAEIVNDRVAA